MEFSQYTTYDSPIEYKNLKLYPVSVRDYIMFGVFSQCLTLEKDTIPDPKIISMNYLEYIYYSTTNNPESQPYVFWLDRLLSLCLKDDESFEDFKESILRYNFDDSHKPFFIINNQKYNYRDFEKIKDIICEQNMVELPDKTVSKEVRDSYEEARRYKRKLNNQKPATLEDYIVSLATVTGWEFEYIYSLSIRKFTRALRRIDNLIHYKIYLSASMSGFVEFKDKSIIKHWLSNLEEKDTYKDVSMSLDDVGNKLSTDGKK